MSEEVEEIMEEGMEEEKLPHPRRADAIQAEAELSIIMKLFRAN